MEMVATGAGGTRPAMDVTDARPIGIETGVVTENTEIATIAAAPESTRLMTLATTATTEMAATAPDPDARIIPSS